MGWPIQRTPLGAGEANCGPSAGFPTARRSFSPSQVPQLMAGAFWLPGVDESVGGGGDITVLDQATEGNDLTTIGVTGDFVGLTNAANGARVWDFSAATYTALRAKTPGDALKWTRRGRYMGWFRWTTLDNGARVFWSHGWKEGPSNNRLILSLTAGDNTRINLMGSHDPSGGITDDPTFTVPDERWKGNYSGFSLLNTWVFLEIQIDMIDGENYSLSNTNQSTKVRVWVNGVLWPGLVGYSAPHDGPNPGEKWGQPPDGPVRGDLYPTTDPFTIGAASNTPPGLNMRGQIGPVYVANEDSMPPIKRYVINRVMNHRRPADA